MPGKSSPRWYVAVLVVQSRVGEAPSAERLVDLQYKLVRAADAEGAYEQALELGKLEATSYKNSEGQEVRWEFAGLYDLYEIDDDKLEHGTEIYSNLLRRDPDDLVMPKDRLSVFWIEANKDRPVRELLEDEDEGE